MPSQNSWARGLIAATASLQSSPTVAAAGVLVQVVTITPPAFARFASQKSSLSLSQPLSTPPAQLLSMLSQISAAFGRIAALLSLQSLPTVAAAGVFGQTATVTPPAFANVASQKSSLSSS